jgi:hypothetical protein
MSAVLLIGRGPLPSSTQPQTGFSQLRTAAFAEALEGTGHAVRLVLLVPQGDAVEPEQWAGTAEVTEEGPGWLEQIEGLSVGADMIVSAGPYNPGRAAVAVANDRPIWADVPGDPLAELAALNRVTTGGLSQTQIAAAQAAACAVLGRADAISVISAAQRHATLGQLGLLGRNLSASSDPLVAVVPITNNLGVAALLPRAPSGDEPIVVALSGAFNPWFDDQSAAAILERTFALRSDLRVIVTGGGINGFYEEGFQRFSRWAEAHPDRVEICGWLPHGEMADRLGSAHVGLSIDHPGPEPELGSRTRLLLFGLLGLEPVSTVRCELAREWEKQGALTPLPFQNIDGAAAVLAGLTVDTDVAARAQALTQTDFGGRDALAPLIAWCEAPRRTTPVPNAEATLAAELEVQRHELAQIYASPTWTALNRLHTAGQATLGRLKSRSK